MQSFEVFIPSLEPTGFDVTLVIEARNWMKALQLALERTTREDIPVRNVLCDIISEELMHVTDYQTRRVFKVRTLREPPEPRASGSLPNVALGDLTQRIEETPTRPDASTPEPTNAAAAAPAATGGTATAAAPLSASQSQIQTVITKAVRPDGTPLTVQTGTGVMRAVGYRAIDSMTGRDGAQVVQERKTPTVERQEAWQPAPGADDERVTDNALEDVFLEITELFEGERSLGEAMAFALDLAMRHVDAESGSVLFADEAGERLYFAVARGPKAEELLRRDPKVPIDQGLAGFCVRNGVAIAITDAAEDPRYFRKVAELLNYTVRSVLCAPIQCEGFAFGALELLNHRRQRGFSGAEANVLTYIGKQTGRYIRNLTLE